MNVIILYANPRAGYNRTVDEKLKSKLKNLPAAPGVYLHKSSSGEVIYVGKAAVLKSRVRQYFQSSKDFDVKTLALVREIVDTDWLETESEIDALFLESELVKRYMPRYNVLLRDDKSQTFIRIDMKSDFPTISFTRNPADDKADYFGPYLNGYIIKKALRYLRRVFPYYTKPQEGARKVDLDVHMGLSPAPTVTSAEYKTSLRKLIQYIQGGRTKLVKEIECDMKAAAKKQDFEQASMHRNRLHAIRELQRRIMFGDKEFQDISKDRALRNLQSLLGLPKIPARIEGFDVSHMSGTNAVASMVVFTNGVSDRAAYRKFKMSVQRNDDTANMKEAITRRFSQKNRAAWGVPDLVLVDGGKGQLKAAIGALKSNNLTVPVVGIAKREDEVIIHASDSNVAISKLQQIVDSPQAGTYAYKEADFYILNLHAGQSNASGHSKNLRGSTIATPAYQDVMHLIQRIRDESHRFAVSYHTALKRSSQTKSTLEDIPGIGPATRKKLIKTFGSLRAVAVVSKDELAALIGENKAIKVVEYLSNQ